MVFTPLGFPHVESSLTPTQLVRHDSSVSPTQPVRHSSSASPTQVVPRTEDVEMKDVLDEVSAQHFHNNILNDNRTNKSRQAHHNISLFGLHLVL